MSRIFLISLLLFTLIGSSYASQESEMAYSSGVKFFKQKKYKTALYYFNKASTEGMNTSALNFNLGVTHYKIGNYKKAEEFFKLLFNDKNFRQISYYNLGLIAEKRKQKQIAIDWYTKAVNNSTKESITQLAENKLDILLNRKPTKRNSKLLSANISVAYGNDDNITSAASNSPSNKDDSFIELFGFFKLNINAESNFKAMLYSIDYATVSAEDFRFYSAGLDYTIKTKKWNFTPEISLVKSTLNNTNYQNTVEFKFTGKYNLENKEQLALRYRYSKINSENALYDYLQGTRQQFRADYKRKIASGKFRLRYQLEVNDRQNTATINYSPTRHTLRARLKHSFKSGWQISEEAGFRSSKYEPVAGVTRNDSRLRIILSTKKEIKKDLSAGLRYFHVNNESNIASETYNRNVISLFADWKF